VDDPRRVAGAATVGCLLAALGLLALVGATALPVALLGTAVLGAAHACVAACVPTLLVRSGDEGRGTVLGLNAAAQSLGVFAGAALGAFGLAVAGWPGVAVALGAPTLVAAVAAATLVRREGDA
jgi:predicted MFS family arabinose efflux permease